MKRSFILIAILVLSHLFAIAQQPAFFVLGESQFKGIQIYDVIQDKDLNYLFSTNEGLYHYDYHKFTKIACTNSRGSSLFNLVSDSLGNIYGNNLNHQVFRINKCKCERFYELSDDEVCPDVSLKIGASNELLISARKVIVLDKDEHVLNRFSTATKYWGIPFRLANGDVIYSFPGVDSILHYSNGHFALEKLTISGELGSGTDIHTFFDLEQKAFCFTYPEKRVYEFDPSNFHLTEIPEVAAFSRSKSTRIYQTKNALWIAGTLPGVSLTNKYPSNANTNLIFEKYFISDVFQDHEGNILLSTFDNGVLVIPNLEIPDVIESFDEDPVVSIFKDPNSSTIYLGSTKGKIMSFDGKSVNLVRHEAERPINQIFGHEGFPYLILPEETIDFFDPLSGKTHAFTVGSLKDVLFIDDNNFRLATNTGIIEGSLDKKNIPILKFYEGLRIRIHMMAYEPKRKLVFASSSNGLYQIDESGHNEKVQYNGNDIFPSAMIAIQGKIIIFTQDQSLLILSEQGITEKSIAQEIAQETIRKLYLHDKHLYARSSHDVYQLDENANFVRNISKDFGLSGTRIFDIALQENQMWLSHAGGVQLVNLSMAFQETQKPLLQISKVKVNDQETESKVKGKFNPEQRKLEFSLASPSLKFRENIRYHYQLVGYDKNWITKRNDGNPILYNALEPGNYTFRAKAENQGKFSQIEEFTFQIASPYYSKWWFLLLSGAVILGLAFLIFRRQLRIQKIKAQQINELNFSKLTAIKSQMNPHFIFNALNSIQDLILKGDVEHSYSYITTFSNLVRSTLNYSEQDFIDFEKEIQLLELYLSLEKLRFKNTFQYYINADEIEDIELPPLLIQPFVENALVHGLLHKEGEKILRISFRMEEALVCTIDDNGIGRANSMAIKERQRQGHESFSGKAIRKRFDILSEVFKGEFGYVYEDLAENGQAIGTRVILKIPIKHQY